MSQTETKVNGEFTASLPAVRAAASALRKMSRSVYWTLCENDGACWISQHHDHVAFEVSMESIISRRTQCALGVPATIIRSWGQLGRPLGVRIEDLCKALECMSGENVSLCVVAASARRNDLLVNDGEGTSVWCNIIDPVYSNLYALCLDRVLPLSINIRDFARALRLCAPFAGWTCFLSSTTYLSGLCMVSSEEQGIVDVQVCNEHVFRRVKLEDEALFWALDGATTHLQSSAAALVVRALPWLGSKVRVGSCGAWLIGEAADLRLPTEKQEGSYPHFDKMFKEVRESKQTLTVQAGEFHGILKRLFQLHGYRGSVEINLEGGFICGAGNAFSSRWGFGGKSDADISEITVPLHNVMQVFQAFSPEEEVTLRVLGTQGPIQIVGSKTPWMETILLSAGMNGTDMCDSAPELDNVPF